MQTALFALHPDASAQLAAASPTRPEPVAWSKGTRFPLRPGPARRPAEVTHLIDEPARQP
jgi:hypothetical protein